MKTDAELAGYAVFACGLDYYDSVMFHSIYQLEETAQFVKEAMLKENKYEFVEVKKVYYRSHYT